MSQHLFSASRAIYTPADDDHVDMLGIAQEATQTREKENELDLLRSTAFPSAHHSPKTVKRNAQPRLEVLATTGFQTNKGR
jgi:hypothetical protein